MNQLTSEQSLVLQRYIHHAFIETDHINTKYTAYGLKQRFSRMHFYVTTEQFIGAMRSEGFSVRMLDDGDAHFNISDYSLFEDL